MPGGVPFQEVSHPRSTKQGEPLPFVSCEGPRVLLPVLILRSSGITVRRGWSPRGSAGRRQL